MKFLCSTSGPKHIIGRGYAHFCATMRQINATVKQQMQETHTQVLVNLATAIAIYHQSVEVLSRKNTKLTGKVAAATATITALR